MKNMNAAKFVLGLESPDYWVAEILRCDNGTAIAIVSGPRSANRSETIGFWPLMKENGKWRANESTSTSWASAQKKFFIEYVNRPDIFFHSRAGEILCVLTELHGPEHALSANYQSVHLKPFGKSATSDPFKKLDLKNKGLACAESILGQGWVSQPYPEFPKAPLRSIPLGNTFDLRNSGAMLADFLKQIGAEVEFTLSAEAIMLESCESLVNWFLKLAVLGLSGISACHPELSIKSASIQIREFDQACVIHVMFKGNLKPGTVDVKTAIRQLSKDESAKLGHVESLREIADHLGVYYEYNYSATSAECILILRKKTGREEIWSLSYGGKIETDRGVKLKTLTLMNGEPPEVVFTKISV